MNEPALFYSPERLKAFFESMDELSRKDNIVQDEFFGKVVGGALGLMNARRTTPASTTMWTASGCAMTGCTTSTAAI